MNNFCTNLRERANETIACEKKETVTFDMEIRQ